MIYLALAVLLVPAAVLIYRFFKVTRRDRIFGSLAFRWNMRFSRNDYAGHKDALAGCYHCSFGHSHKITSVISGKHRAVPLSVFDYSYEAGCKFQRKIVKKTVFTAELNCVAPDIVIISELELAPFNRYSSFIHINLLKIHPELESNFSLLSHFNKYRIFTDKPYLVKKFLNIETLEALALFKSVCLEINNNKLVVISPLVNSELRLAQLAGRVIQTVKTLKKVNRVITSN